MVVEHPQAPVVLRRASCGATSSRRAPDAGTAAKLEALYVELRLRDPPGARGDPVLAAALRRARGWSSRRPSSWPACCAPASAGSPPTRGTGSLSGCRPGPLLPARRLGLGRQALAGHQHHARALGGGRRLALEGDTEPIRTRTYPAETAEPGARPARDFWGAPTLTDRRRARALAHVRPHARSPPTPRRGSARQRQNALRQLIAGSPDYQTSS